MSARIRYVLVGWLLMLVMPVFASDSWVEIGSARAKASANCLTIFPQNDQSYSQLRFHLADGSLFLNQVLVYLVNGSVFRIDLQTNLRAFNSSDYGSGLLPRVYSRAAPLVGSQQSPIRKVRVFYTFRQRQSPNQAVTLTLLGLPVAPAMPLQSSYF